MDAVIVDRMRFALRDAIRHLPECGYDLTFSDFFPAVRSFPVLRTFGKSYGTVLIPTALTLFIIAQKMNFVNLLKNSRKITAEKSAV